MKPPYETLAKYVEYLKTLHPKVGLHNSDGSLSGIYTLNLGSANIVSGSWYFGHADAVILYEAYVNYHGTNPVGDYILRITTSAFVAIPA